MNINQSLWKAIEEAPMIRLRCKDKERTVEPHDYGIHNGKTMLLAYQVAGSSSHALPACLALDGGGYDLGYRDPEPDVFRRPTCALCQTP